MLVVVVVVALRYHHHLLVLESGCSNWSRAASTRPSVRPASANTSSGSIRMDDRVRPGTHARSFTTSGVGLWSAATTGSVSMSTGVCRRLAAIVVVVGQDERRGRNAVLGQSFRHGILQVDHRVGVAALGIVATGRLVHFQEIARLDAVVDFQQIECAVDLHFEIAVVVRIELLEYLARR